MPGRTAQPIEIQEIDIYNRIEPNDWSVEYNWTIEAGKLEIP